jgi:hypothetical protein
VPKELLRLKIDKIVLYGVKGREDGKSVIHRATNIYMETDFSLLVEQGTKEFPWFSMPMLLISFVILLMALIVVLSRRRHCLPEFLGIKAEKYQV